MLRIFISDLVIINNSNLVVVGQVL